MPPQKPIDAALSLKRQAWLNAFHDVQAAFRSRVALRGALQAAVEQFRVAIGARVAQIYLCSDGTGQLELVVSAGTSLAPGGVSPHQPGRGYARLAISRGPVFYLGDLEEEQDVECRELLLALGLRSCLAVPVPGPREVLGVLVAFGRRALDCDTETTRFAQTIAGQIGLAVDHARLRQQLERSGSSHQTGRVSLNLGAGLTSSQLIILQLLIDGKSNRQIAETVHLSENTVKFHIRELFRKLSARNRVEAAMAALKGGLI